MKRSKRNAIIFILMLSLVLISCIFNPKPRDKWVKGQLIVTLFPNVNDEDFDEFLLDYQEYELRQIEILSPSLTIGDFFYNKMLIDGDNLRKKLLKDIRVNTVTIMRPGNLVISLYGFIVGKELLAFLDDYKNYSLILENEISIRATRLLGFNHKQIDCKVFLEMIKNDYRVDIAQFNHYLNLEFGGKNEKK